MGRLLWCPHCTKRQPTEQSDVGFISCTGCGSVLDQDIYSNEATFVKNAAGQSQLSGNFVKTVQGDYSASRERTLELVRNEITEISYSLCGDGADQIARPALAFYTIALERNFTRGRRRDQVAAACLYIACRENKKPYLLIEFSEILGVNVYVLGAVFLQLCQLLRLDEHPIVRKPVDPSLFVHRFTNVLLGGSHRKNLAVEKTALRIMASMKQNWMQTGRKPSGLFGAALYISALSHGHKFSKSDIGKIVHVCEDTLRKRLFEFEDTDSGSLTIEELNQKAEELEMNKSSNEHANNEKGKCGDGILLCEHKDSESPHFAHGLCKVCYDEFIEISGGLDGGAEPPAFQRAERERIAKAHAEANATDSLCMTNKPSKAKKKTLNSDENETLEETEARGLSNKDKAMGSTNFESQVDDHANTENNDDPECFVDVDDEEVERYLYNEEEKPLVKVIWEELNREYVQEQEAKEAAAKEAHDAEMAFLRNCTPEDLKKREFAANAAANAAKLKKEQRQKRKAEMKEPKTAGEAAFQELTKKRLSSRVNEDVLKDLLGENTRPKSDVEDIEAEDTFVSKKRPRYDEKDIEAEENVDDWGGDYYEEENNVRNNNCYSEEQQVYGFDDDYF